jgi:hypothetical protein
MEQDSAREQTPQCRRPSSGRGIARGSNLGVFRHSPASSQLQPGLRDPWHTQESLPMVREKKAVLICLMG